MTIDISALLSITSASKDILAPKTDVNANDSYQSVAYEIASLSPEVESSQAEDSVEVNNRYDEDVVHNDQDQAMDDVGSTTEDVVHNDQDQAMDDVGSTTEDDDSETEKAEEMDSEIVTQVADDVGQSFMITQQQLGDKNISLTSGAMSTADIYGRFTQSSTTPVLGVAATAMAETTSVMNQLRTSATESSQMTATTEANARFASQLSAAASSSVTSTTSSIPLSSLPMNAEFDQLDGLGLLTALQGKNGFTPQAEKMVTNLLSPAGAVDASALAKPTANTMQWGPLSLPSQGTSMEFAKAMLTPVRDQLRFQMNHGINHAELRLDPADLGKVDLNIRLDGDRLHIQMHAANNNVRDALQSGLERLRAELAQEYQGDIQFDVGERQEQGTSQQNAQEMHERHDTVIADNETQERSSSPEALSGNDINLLA